MSFLKGLGGVLGGVSAGYVDPTSVWRKKAEEDLLRQRLNQEKEIKDYDRLLRKMDEDEAERKIISSLETTLPNEPIGPGLPTRPKRLNARLAYNESIAGPTLKGMAESRKATGALPYMEETGRTQAQGELTKSKLEKTKAEAEFPLAAPVIVSGQQAIIAGNEENKATSSLAGKRAEGALGYVGKTISNDEKAESLRGLGTEAELANKEFEAAMRPKLNETAKAAIELGLSKAQAETEVAKLIKLIGEGIDTEKISNLSEAQRILAGVLTRGLTEEQIRLMQIRAANMGGNQSLLGDVVSSIREGSGGVFRSPVQPSTGTSSVPQSVSSQSSMSPEDEEKERLKRLKGLKFSPDGA